MRLSSGEQFGPYEIVDRLGAGGMGEVYRARDPRLNRVVAIKLLPSDRVADEDNRRRFLQEAQVASGLRNAHIVSIYDLCSDRGSVELQQQSNVIRRYSVSDGGITDVYRTSGRPQNEIALSSDERYLYFGQFDRSALTIELLEGFH